MNPLGMDPFAGALPSPSAESADQHSPLPLRAERSEDQAFAMLSACAWSPLDSSSPEFTADAPRSMFGMSADRRRKRKPVALAANSPERAVKSPLSLFAAIGAWLRPAHAANGGIGRNRKRNHKRRSS